MAAFKFLGQHNGCWMFGMNMVGMNGHEAQQVEFEVTEWSLNEAAGDVRLGNNEELVPKGAKDGSVLYVVMDRLRDVVTFEQMFEVTGLTPSALSSASFVPAREAVAA